MSDLPFLRQLIIVLAATISIVFVFQKLRLPTIVGFLLAGVIIGPNGLQLITSLSQVETLAEIGVVLFQDLCIVPMMLLLPVLGQSGKGSLVSIVWAVAKALFALVLIVWAARRFLPRLLHQVALLRNRAIFILFVVLICLGTAWLASESGLSLALGALIAGLVISESELSHQIIADVLPLRDCFSGIFFISIGMLLNLDLLTRDFLTPLMNLLLIVGIKSLLIFAVFWWLYGSIRLAVLLGLSLAQVGEFSFILAKACINYKLLTPANEQLFLAGSILSMIATPFLIQSVHGLAVGLEAMLGASPESTSAGETAASENVAQGHVVVVGYGLNGQNLARVLKEVGIPYRVLEMDPDLVRCAKAAGEPIFFGDGTRPEILQQAGIRQARVVVIAISDPAATARVVSQARRLRPDLYIIVRTRYVAEIDHLYRLGANQVIPEEFETSVEIFARVLEEYHVPRNVISLQVDLIRKEHYSTLRGLRLQGKQLDELNQFLVGTTTDIFSIVGASPVVGKSLEEVDLRSRCGATVIAVVRAGKSYHNLGADFALAAGDMLVRLGDHKALDDAAQILNPQTNVDS